MPKKHPTAAIYNRWLFTLGGGEQVTFAYAEVLRDLGYQTTLLTHKKVDLRAAGRKMNVDLHNITVRYIPFVSPKELSKYSELFEVFINTSYLDFFSNRSKKGILSVFFPGEIYLTPWEYFKRKLILPSFRLFFIYPTQFEGFLFDEYKEKEIYKWLGKTSKISFNSHHIFSLSVELYFPTFYFSLAQLLQFQINGRKSRPVWKGYNHEKNRMTFRFESKEPIKSFIIHKPSSSEEIALIRLTIPTIRYYLYNVFKEFFPRWEMRLHGGPGITTLNELQSYQTIITISRFCKHWITKYWGLPSKIIYPPVNIQSFAPARQKQNWISHIGRFFVTGHSKKQLELIRVFKDLCDSKMLVGWEFHLLGSVHEGNKHQHYFDLCVQEAVGYPIYFHIGASFTELQRTLAQSKLYWHATGLDEDPNKQPILMEHFGITTVEAMASGCVPLVINAGGQPEIIVPGSGYVWNTREELKDMTATLASNKQLRKSMMQGAIERSRYYSKETFKERFKKILNEI